jgi:hypothetical protein
MAAVNQWIIPIDFVGIAGRLYLEQPKRFFGRAGLARKMLRAIGRTSSAPSSKWLLSSWVVSFPFLSFWLQSGISCSTVRMWLRSPSIRAESFLKMPCKKPERRRVFGSLLEAFPETSKISEPLCLQACNVFYQQTFSTV